MWWVALAFTLGLMALFHLLTRAGPLEARAALSLGFLLIIAHLGGELAKRVRLPRITGFLVTGFVVGPGWLGLVRADEVEALRFVADAAVALIAFAAGSELTLDMLRRERVPLARAAGGAILFPFAIVAAVVFSVSPWFPLTVHQSVGDAVAVSLVLGTIAAASSPALTMALIDELDARAGKAGVFARSVLGVSVAQDVLVVVLFTLVLAVGRPLASAGALDVVVAWTTLLLLVGSVAAGSALGYAVARYLRIVRRDTPLFLVVLAFFTAELARLANVETMLVALAAGFYLENFAPAEGHRLRGDLQRGSLPVYVAFFALAGAGLQLDILKEEEAWGWVVLLVCVRAVLGLRLGLRWAGRSPAVTPDLARYGWLGLISQAGVALGLAAVARRAFPEWGVSLEALVVALIGVHQIVGPLCFRYGLRLTSELSEGEHVTDKAAALGAAPVPGSGGV
ncbi:MAG TPA: cation:proton antiporter [Gemmatimonadales bacterium]|jgi:Kef-type K+ transport system membrane component KefB|nr:cation:proton antiporter [Gemmatimonadales bacterium]